MKLKWFAVTVLAGSLCWADVREGDHVFSGNVGSAAPLSQIDLTGAGGGTADMGSAGAFVAGQYFYQAFSRIGFGLELNYADFPGKDSDTLIPAANSTVSSNSFLGLAVAKIHFVKDRLAAPYFLLGLGFHRSSLKIDASPDPGFGWRDTLTTEKRTLVDDTQSSAALALGFGVDFSINPNFFLGFEGRYQGLGEVTYATKAQTASATGVTSIKGSSAMLAFFGRIGFKFGGGAEPASNVSDQGVTPDAPASTPFPAVPAQPAPPSKPAAPGGNDGIM